MREQIIEEIRRLAAANGGRAPGRQTFERATGIKNWCGVYWARWNDALAEAGFAPNSFNGRSDQTVILRKLAEAVRHFGRVPSTAELRMYGKSVEGFPSHTTQANHFKTKSAMMDQLAAWTTSHAQFADVAAILATRPQPASRAERDVEASGVEGLVYLIRSGAHFKIGRSDQIERRVREIKVALPEAAALVHAIRTDDPPGIEAYWHRRFADRRANGEWFRLTAADVAAFRRRKYQ